MIILEANFFRNPRPLAQGSICWRGKRRDSDGCIGVAMTLLCPLCKSVAQELDRTGDATGFDCKTDGKFKVANTVFADGRVRNYTNQQWEAALRKAKQRTRRGSGLL